MGPGAHFVESMSLEFCRTGQRNASTKLKLETYFNVAIAVVRNFHKVAASRR